MSDRLLTMTLRGRGVTPATFDVIDLLDILSHLRSAILHTANIREGQPPTGEVRQPILSLSGVREGSYEAVLTVPVSLQETSHLLVHQSSAGQFALLPRKAWKSMHKMGELLLRRGLEATLAAGDISLTVSEDHQIPEPPGATLRGTTTIYGRLERIGGKGDPTARVTLQRTGKAITIKLTVEQAKDLEAQRKLYTVVGLEGIAEWDARNWDIVNFKLVRILSFIEGSPVEGFAELREAAGDIWDGVDPDAYVKELRGEDDT